MDNWQDFGFKQYGFAIIEATLQAYDNDVEKILQAVNPFLQEIKYKLVFEKKITISENDMCVVIRGDVTALVDSGIATEMEMLRRVDNENQDVLLYVGLHEPKELAEFLKARLPNLQVKVAVTN